MSSLHPHVLKRLASADASWEQMTCIADRTAQIKESDIIAVTTIRDELIRLPHFFEYYRNLGVNHFLFIDNLSTEPVLNYLSAQPDCSIWHTKEPYENTFYGVNWMNAVLKRFCVGHWALSVDVDEYLVYPHIEKRKLPELIHHLEELGKPSLYSLMIDMYSRSPIDTAQLKKGQNPLEVTPYYDANGYYGVYTGHEDTWVRGGPRLRIFNDGIIDGAPAMNKTPLVKWQADYAYYTGAHTLYPRHLNHAHKDGLHGPTGALLHYKYLSFFRDKVQFAVKHGNHYDGSKEYKKYQSTLGKAESLSLYSSISSKYLNSQSLVDDGLMTCGSWL